MAILSLESRSAVVLAGLLERVCRRRLPGLALRDVRGYLELLPGPELQLVVDAMFASRSAGWQARANRVLLCLRRDVRRLNVDVVRVGTYSKI